jgi:hypothetical protein
VCALPLAWLVGLFSEGGRFRFRVKPGARKKVLSKTTRAARETAKEIVKSQALLASGADKLAKNMARRSSKSAARIRKTATAIVRWPYVRFVRLLRLARYGVATRILGRR